jgi:hypothetical protein
MSLHLSKMMAQLLNLTNGRYVRLNVLQWRQMARVARKYARVAR